MIFRKIKRVKKMKILRGRVSYKNSFGSLRSQKGGEVVHFFGQSPKK
jgi:hypothetical protein